MKKHIVFLLFAAFAISALYAQDKRALAKSDSLYAEGVKLYKAKQYRKAIPLFTESDQIDKTELDSTSNRRDYSAMWLASCYYNVGDTLTAQGINDYYRFVPVDRRLTVKSDSLAAIGDRHLRKEKYREALSFFEKGAEVERIVIGDKHIWYGNSVLACANLSHFIRDSIKAISLCSEYSDIIKYNYGELSEQYISALMTSAGIYRTYHFEDNLNKALLCDLKAQELSYAINDTLLFQNAAYYVAFDYTMLGKGMLNEDGCKYIQKAMDIIVEVFGKEHPDYIILLNYLTTVNASLGNYNEAIRLGTETLNIYANTYGKEHPNYVSLLENLSVYYSYAGNGNEAIQLASESLITSGRLIEYADSLSKLADKNSSLGKYSEAVRLETEALDFYAKFLGTDHPNYATSLNALASYYCDMGNYNEAIRLTTEALRIFEKTLGCEHLNYTTSLNDLALYNSYIGNYEEAIQLAKEALEIREQTLGKEHTKYASSLGTLSLINSDLGNYNEAIRLTTEELEIYKNTYGIEYSDYANVLSNLGLYYSYLGNYDKAVQLTKEALDIRAKVLGKEHPDYALSLNNLASINSDLGNYGESIRLGTEALEINAKILGTEHLFYATSLSILASDNSHLGNYDEAIKLETEALEIRARVLGEEHPDYANSLANLASINRDLGNYGEAIQLSIKALEIRAKVLGKKHPNYANSLANLASINSALGNYSEAIRLEMEALDIRAKVFGNKHPDDALSLNNLASYFSSLGNDSDAIRMSKAALKIQEKVLGTEHPDYATSLNNLSSYYCSLGNYDEAIQFATEALRIRTTIFGKKHQNYATSLNNLASINCSMGNYNEAIRLEKEALNIVTNVPGMANHYPASSINNIAFYYYFANNTDSLAKYAHESTQVISNFIYKTFADLTTNERRGFWQQYEAWFSRWNPYFANLFHTKSFIANAYNGILLSKGLLLNSEMEMNRILLESEDEETFEAYKELQTNRIILNKLYEKPIEERYMNTDSLENVVTQMERDLVQRSKTYGDYTKNLTIKWEDVQQRLGKNDMAVEFASFVHTQDSIMYVAFILKPNMETPQMVTLFEEKQLSSIPKSRRYTTPDVSNLVWGKLQGYLDGTDNVYFAPSGELHNIAIESLPNPNGEGLMSDRRRFYRLSSTRELAVAKDRTSIAEAVLYGGLRYDADIQQMENNSEKYQLQGVRDFTLFNIADSLDFRRRGERGNIVGAEYLPATKTETEGISQSLKKTSINISLFTDDFGTEASFKDLSGKKKNLLHIATHGFYWTESETQAQEHLSFLQLGADKSPRNVEDKALTRSGLLFAGANNALMGEVMPENMEDGILTAKEISTLDLRGLDLVVLSACQTGLGEITGDGVFGLQRGFKKAGANTLLMSLWKVDDRATQMLMNKFYDNLISGKSKHDSLRDAQRYIREYETDKAVKPYQDPMYWAAFILLDGIN